MCPSKKMSENLLFLQDTIPVNSRVFRSQVTVAVLTFKVTFSDRVVG